MVIPGRRVLVGHRVTSVLALILVANGVAFIPFDLIAKTKGSVPQEDWYVSEGYSIISDTSGFDQPTAIAFVESPGANPEDPLYFVAELLGVIKVVCNDRSVHIFADDFMHTGVSYLSTPMQEYYGLVGLCIEPLNGYVFATFSYKDEIGAKRNRVLRFKTKPKTFSTEPTEKAYIFDQLKDYATVGAHNIGSCEVFENQLLVGMGDGYAPTKTQDLNSPLGKILSMDFDGQPWPGNPFYQTDDGIQIQDYVWSYGFRNPFGIAVAEGAVFVADNGINIDRFNQIEKGTNYLWAGSDADIGARADVVFSPAIGVTHVAFIPEHFDLARIDHQNSFMVASSGTLGGYQPKGSKKAGIISFQFDFIKNRVSVSPRYILKNRGDHYFAIVGIARGPDGIYFSTFSLDGTLDDTVYKLAYDPDSAPTSFSAKRSSAIEMINDFGCLGCHRLDGKGTHNAPSLDWVKLIPPLKQRLNSESYREQLDRVDLIRKEPYVSFQHARNAIREARDTNQLKMWMQYHIHNPQFDNPDTQMPNLGVSLKDAEAIASYLIMRPSKYHELRQRIDRIIPYSPPRIRHVLLSLGFGILIGGIMVIALRVFLK